MAEPFSAGYVLVRDAEVCSWSDEVAAMADDLYDALAHRYGEPVVGRVGGLTYYFKRHQTGIPPMTVAVPDTTHDDPSALLVQK
jgi:hypothetical protein